MVVTMPLQGTMKHENVIARRGAPPVPSEVEGKQSPACEGGDCFAFGSQ